MALTQVTGPYPIFTDLDGSPLDDGYLYIGAINQDPETNPIQVFWDSALTIPATQPIRTNSGYAYRNGTPALMYTGGAFSITIRNKRQEFVLYSPVGYGFDPAAVSASVVKNDFIGNGVQVAFVLSASPSTILATNIFINGVYQEKDSYTLSGNTITFSIAPPLNSSIEILTNETGIINSGNATAISYTYPASGAVAQTVQTRLEQYVSVKDFGAVGDGVADDTAAIQAAIDSGERSIFIPSGTYKITAPVNIPTNTGADAIHLHGAGKQQSILQASGTFNTIINIGNLAAQTIRGRYENFCVSGTGATVQYGIYGSRVEEHTFFGVWAKGFATAAISTGYGYVNNFIDCECSYNTGDGLLLNKDYGVGGGNNAIWVSGCLLFLNDGWGFRAYSGYGVWVDGCTIEENKKGGIYFQGISGFRICSYFEKNAAVGYRPTNPDYQIYSDIVLNGSGNDLSLGDAFPCDSGIIEGCNLMDNTGAGRTSFVYNGGANNLSIKNCHSTNTNTTPLYAETYEGQYKGANVSIENCGSFTTLISELRPAAATNNTKSAYIDLRGPSATAVNPWLTYSLQNLAEQDFNTWSVISGGSATSFQRSANTNPAFGGRPVWQIASSAAGSSDNNGFTIPATSFAEFSGKLVWFGIWSYISDANCFAVPYTNQQAFNVNPLTLGAWQFSAVSFPWPASGNVICGVYKSGSATGSVYLAAPMLMPVGVSVQTALGSIYETRQWYGSAAPTTGAWFRGDVVLNSAPSAAGTPGWVCTVSGTPGTWRAMANLA